MGRYNFLLIMVLSLILLMCVFQTTVFAGNQQGMSKGETVYVPAYSHIYSGNREQPFLLTVTLSIRNIDLNRSVTINQVDFYETQGKKIHAYLEKPITLKPLESTRYIVPMSDKQGGSGANFIVVWESGQLVNEPIIESVMIATQSQQGISFTSRGRNIKP